MSEFASKGGSRGDRSPTSSSVWKSVSRVLLESRCWICNETFVRGKPRKQFTISQLLEYYSVKRKLFVSGCLTGKTCFDQFQKDIFDEKYGNLNGCWNRLCDLQFNKDRIDADLASVDIGKWVSSLACCNSADCEEVLKSITGDLPLFDPTNQKFLCPPGCGCDNPWQFVKA